MSCHIRSSQRDCKTACCNLDSHEKDACEQEASVATRPNPADDSPSNGNQSVNHDHEVSNIEDLACNITCHKDAYCRDGPYRAGQSQGVKMTRDLVNKLFSSTFGERCLPESKSINDDSSKSPDCT
jgi:hypothetical protein